MKLSSCIVFRFFERKYSIQCFIFSSSTLKISDLLNTEKPDERAIMTYVSCYYHAFQGAMQVQWFVIHELYAIALFECLTLTAFSHQP